VLVICLENRECSTTYVKFLVFLLALFLSLVFSFSVDA